MTQETPNLPKWPFAVGDALCVLAAALIGLRADGPAAYFFIFLLLVVGSLILMVPFVREFSARVRLRRLDLREELEARHAMVVSIATDAQAASRGVVQLSQRIGEQLDGQQAAADHFSKTAAALEKTLGGAGNLGAEVSKVLRQKEDARIAELNEEAERLRGAQAERVEDIVERLESLESVSAKEFKAMQAAVAALSAQMAALAEKLSRAAARAPRAPKRNLMEKAFSHTHEGGDAVSRIIAGTEGDNPENAAAPEPESALEADADEADAAEVSAESQGAPDDTVAPEAGEVADDDKPASELESAPEASMPSASPEAPTDEAPKEPVAPAPEPKAPPAPAAADAPVDELIVEPIADDGSPSEDERPFDNAAHTQGDEPAPQVTDPLSALAQATPVKEKVAKKVRGKHAVVLARVLIGIGNKPFVRGTGGGLSPDKGVPMEFVEIGLWRWVGAEGENLADVVVYKNDETPADTPPFAVAAGEEVETQPAF